MRPQTAELLPRIVRHHGEPFADSSALPSFCVAELASQHVTVALTGDGGDESFAGYARYGALLRWAQLDAVPERLRRLVGAGMAATAGRATLRSSARLARAGMMLAESLPSRYLLQMALLKPQEKAAGYTPAFRALASRGAPDPLALLPWHAELDPVAWMMRHDQHFYLPDCLLPKADIASMAHALELRSPLLDQRVVELAARMPTRFKRGRGGGKRIFKRAFGHLLPPAVLSKPKTGFAIPVASWLRGELAELLRGTLLDERAERRGLLRPRFTRQLVSDHLEGRRDWSNRLWALMCLELWFREFID